MSLAQADVDDRQTKSEEASKPKEQFKDPQFVNQLLGSLPGVNPNDPAIQSALLNMKKDDETEGDKKKKEEEDKKE
jgi:26S proteasome regulatory subunit N10